MSGASSRRRPPRGPRAEGGPPTADGQPPEPPEPTAESRPSPLARLALRGAMIWPLVTGLAVGFAVGREAYRFGLDRGGDVSGASTAFIAAESGGAAKGAYASEAEFPSGWVKAADLGASGAPLNGLNDAQRTTVMQALNQRNCECGCAFGTLAECLHKDPNCPRSPQMAKLAADLVKQGKGLSDILAAIDAKQKEMSGGQKPSAPAADQPPPGPKKVELAAWNPRKGPKAAKVTIVEFSDFQ